MTILYKNINGNFYYWETWKEDDNESSIIHFGKVGEKGTTETSPTTKIAEIIKKLEFEGYKVVPIEDFEILIIEYEIQGEWGNEQDLHKRYSLQDRMQETLGWTGLGFCDGGSIGAGTMEVCCFVVNFKLAKEIIEDDLRLIEYYDYKRIYLG